MIKILLHLSIAILLPQLYDTAQRPMLAAVRSCTKEQLAKYDTTNMAPIGRSLHTQTFDFNTSILKTDYHSQGFDKAASSQAEHEIFMLDFCKGQQEVVDLADYCQHEAADGPRNYFVIEKCEGRFDEWLKGLKPSFSLMYDTLAYLTMVVEKLNAMGVYYLNPALGDIKRCNGRIKFADMSRAAYVPAGSDGGPNPFKEIRNLAVLYEKIAALLKVEDPELDNLITTMKKASADTRDKGKPSVTTKQLIVKLDYLKETFKTRVKHAKRDFYFPEYMFGMVLFRSRTKLNYSAEFWGFLKNVLNVFPFAYTADDIKHNSILGSRVL